MAGSKATFGSSGAVILFSLRVYKHTVPPGPILEKTAPDYGVVYAQLKPEACEK